MSRECKYSTREEEFVRSFPVLKALGATHLAAALSRRFEARIKDVEAADEEFGTRKLLLPAYAGLGDFSIRERLLALITVGNVMCDCSR
jgi:hypothetical protein